MPDAVLSLEARIAASKRARAVERAWKVAKSLEADRSQVESLRWIEPQRLEGKGISRQIDFAAEFPAGETYLMPVPMNVTVAVPARVLVPNENIEAIWTMPILSRMRTTESPLNQGMLEQMGLSGQSPSLRNRIDMVSFLPFPKADAPEEEQFTPQFMVGLEINAPLGKSDNYFAAVARYGGKVIKQFVTSGHPRYVGVYADPKTQTHFSAKMLVTMGAEELANIADNAGELEIQLYRITKSGGISMKDILMPRGDVIDFPGSSRGSLSYGGGLLSSPTRGGDMLKRGGPSLSVIPGLSLPRPAVSPAQVPREVGDVSLGEGTRGEKVEYSSLSGYVADTEWRVQPIHIRFLGVREASEPAAMRALQQIGSGYHS